MGSRGRHQHKATAGKSQPIGRVRIIGGRWRGSLIRVPEVSGLRPSGVRVRETLFNWLQPWLPGTRCLDLFAGSGALSLEAASRGAGAVVAIEYNRIAAQALRDNCARLNAQSLQVLESDALHYIEQVSTPFDIVFVDPPFASELLDATLARVDLVVAPSGWLYLELPRQRQWSLPRGNWRIAQDQCLGQVRICLLRKVELQSAAGATASSPL